MKYRGSEHLSHVPRALLLSAAGEVVAAQGYDRLTVSRLASRAGVSAGTFHNLFDGTEDCFVQAFEEAALNAEGIATYEYGRTKGVWRVKARAALGAVLAFLDERPDLCAVLVVEPVKAGPRMAERYAQTVQRVARALHASAKTTTNGRWLSVTDFECTVQSVLSLARGLMSEAEPAPLASRVGVLMSMVVLRIEGCAAAEREINRAADAAANDAVAADAPGRPKDRNEVLKGLGMRVTYRTLRVLEAIVKLQAAELSGREGVCPSNRQIASLADITDEGQISKLLRRLKEKGLIEEVTGNVGKRSGLAYEWRLTKSGEELVRAARTDETRDDRRPRHERRGAHR